MKKAGLFIACLLLLVDNMSLRELGKLPVLVQHYWEHREQNPELNFFEYFAHHYSDDHGNDGDQERDRQLPFKHIDNNISGHLFSPEKPLSVRVVLSFYKVDFPLLADPNLPNPECMGLLRPPQL